MKRIDDVREHDVCTLALKLLRAGLTAEMLREEATCVRALGRRRDASLLKQAAQRIERGIVSL